MLKGSTYSMQTSVVARYSFSHKYFVAHETRHSTEFIPTPLFANWPQTCQISNATLFSGRTLCTISVPSPSSSFWPVGFLVWKSHVDKHTFYPCCLGSQLLEAKQLKQNATIVIRALFNINKHGLQLLTNHTILGLYVWEKRFGCSGNKILLFSFMQHCQWQQISHFWMEYFHKLWFLFYCI